MSVAARAFAVRASSTRSSARRWTARARHARWNSSPCSKYTWRPEPIGFEHRGHTDSGLAIARIGHGRQRCASGSRRVPRRGHLISAMRSTAPTSRRRSDDVSCPVGHSNPRRATRPSRQGGPSPARPACQRAEAAPASGSCLPAAPGRSPGPASRPGSATIVRTECSRWMRTASRRTGVSSYGSV